MRTRKVWRSFLKTTNFTCPLVTKSLYDNCHYELMELITRSGKHEPIDHSPAINCCDEVDEIIRTRGVCWWWFDFLRWNRTLKRQHFLILFSELVLVSLASIVSQRMMKKHVRVLIDLSLSSVFHDPWQIQFVPSSPFQSSKQIHSWRIIPIPPECSYVFQLQLCTTYPQQWDPIRFLSRYKKCNVFFLKTRNISSSSLKRLTRAVILTIDTERWTRIVGVKRLTWSTYIRVQNAIPSANTSCMRTCVSMGKTASLQLSSCSSSSKVRFLVWLDH